VIQKIHHYKNSFLRFYQDHEVLVAASIFIFGFVFDLLTLGRIDDSLGLIQQAVYLFLLGGLILYEVKEKLGKTNFSPRVAKLWQYQNLVAHFLFGSLLSVYTIFYYTSASALTSFIFILLLAGLMMANEFPQIQRMGLAVRVILFSICLLSYFAFFYPILMGHVGVVPFWLGFISSLLAAILIWKLQFAEDEEHKKFLKANILRPVLGVHLFFLIGYYFALIPPVPVAVKKIGVYYNVTKENGSYIGSHLNPSWKFWSKGSQDFQYRPGDKIVVLMSVFSPARFEDKVFLKWYWKSPKSGWTLQDSIPLTILGGREEGFRGFGEKNNYSIGDWRVEVETSDEREVGRINFSVTGDPTLEERTFKQDKF
jgi:hypothetical protein